MKRYMCDVCGTQFDEPLIVERPEHYGDWFCTDRAELCPICATSHFSVVEECSCGGVRRPGDKFCKECRGGLLKRVADFFDTLTAEEEEQFDDWMDGDSITNRKRWT